MTRKRNGSARRARRRTTMVAAMLAGPVIGSVFVLQATNAAFVATTQNPSNAWTAGSVNLTDNDAGVAMFSSADGVLKPGGTIQKCMTVTYSGTLPSRVRLYATSLSTGSQTALDSYLDVTVRNGAVGSSCVGNSASGTLWQRSMRLNLLRSMVGNFTDGLKLQDLFTDWTTATPAAGATVTETRAFQFEVTLNDSLASSANASIQGAMSNINFVWEAQNT